MSKTIWHELYCVILGHSWDTTGYLTCQEHQIKFNDYKICSCCELQKNIGARYCLACYNEFIGKVEHVGENHDHTTTI